MVFDLVATLQTVSLIGLFLWMVLYGLLFFIPALPPYELVLLTIGYAMSVGELPIIFSYIVLVLAAVVVHSIFFTVTKQGGSYVENYIEKHGKKTLKRYEARFEKDYFGSYLLLVFVPKIRLFASVISGSLNVSWKKFLLTSCIANSVIVGFYLFLGYFFHKTIRSIITTIQGWQNLLFYVVMLVVVFILFIVGKWFYRRWENSSY